LVNAANVTNEQQINEIVLTASHINHEYFLRMWIFMGFLCSCL